MGTSWQRVVEHYRAGNLRKAIAYKLGRADPIGDQYYGEVAANYELRRVKQDAWNKEEECMRDLLKTLPGGLAVLDVPFGTGRFIRLYAERGMSISGLDSSRDMIKAALENYTHELSESDIQVGDAKALPWAEDSFDLVVCFRFLSQIVSFGEAREVLHELVRVTRSYAIVEFSARPSTRRLGKPREGKRMGSQLSDDQLRNLLISSGLLPVYAQKIPQGSSLVIVYLCEKDRKRS